MNVFSARFSSRYVLCSATGRAVSMSPPTTSCKIEASKARKSMDDIVQKSPCDNKSYRYFVLPNGLRSLLISDPDICIGAVTRDVKSDLNFQDTA